MLYRGNTIVTQIFQTETVRFFLEAYSDRPVYISDCAAGHITSNLGPPDALLRTLFLMWISLRLFFAVWVHNRGYGNYETITKLLSTAPPSFQAIRRQPAQKVFLRTTSALQNFLLAFLVSP